MNKKVALLLSAVMTVTTLIPGSSYAVGQKEKLSLKDRISQVSILRNAPSTLRGSNDTSDSIFVDWDAQRNVPRFVSGDLGSDQVLSRSQAITFLNENKDAFSMDHATFKVIHVEEDSDTGSKHYKAQVMVGGIPVFGSELVVHTNSQGEVYAINGQTEPDIENKDYMQGVKLTTTDAIAKAKSGIGLGAAFQKFTAQPKAALYHYKAGNEWKVVYEAVLQFVDPYPANWSIFVDAATGEIVGKLNQATYETGVGIGVNGGQKNINISRYSSGYALIDTTRTARVETYSANYSTQLPGSIVTDSDTNFTSSQQAAAVDAHYHAGIVLDYYKNKHGRNSFDNRGTTVRSSVNYQRNYNNAFWNGSQMTYGDGDGRQFAPLSGALDIVAHEITHAVTTYTANLIYQNQSGALNEHMSDVFGTIAEGDPNDWDCGEDVYTPGKAGDALRSMKQPSLYRQPEHMNQYVNTSQDNGGVHINSGIPNKAFYNVASKIGFDKTGKIYYKALTQYLTRSSQFMDCRNALLQSTADLYGKNSQEYYTVQKGWADIGVGQPPVISPTPTSTTYPTPTSTTYPTPTSGSENYALRQPVKASANYSSYAPENAVDGDANSFFAVEASTAQWIYVDLGSTRNINSMKLKWSQTNYPTSYQIQVWNGSAWSTVSNQSSNGDWDTLGFSSALSGRYVRLNLAQSNSSYFTLYEWEIYGGSVVVPTPTSTVKPTPTSTVNPTTPPTQTPPPSGDAWKTYTYYNAGDTVTYGGKAYVCLMAHTSLPGWEPANVPALWRLK